MAKIDLTTIGVKVGWAVGDVGTKPAKFEQFFRVKKIGGISLENDKIELTALEATVKEYAAGLADTGGTWPITIGLNDDTLASYEKVMTAYKNGKKTGKSIWWDVFFPGLSKSFYVVAEPGEIPMPDIDLSSPADIVINCTINKYVGLDVAVEPSVTPPTP